MNFKTVIGYILGILIAFVMAKIFLRPFKFIFKIIINSIIAFFVILLINKFYPYTSVFIGANPITSVFLGVFGIPGLCVILILQILF
jgi:inhibitor of the pro-sigma K processing machinery